MLGVCLRKLCPQDSFGYAFREKKTVRKSTPEACKTGPWGVQNGLREASGRLFRASWAQLGRAARGAVLKPLGRPRPLLGASWGSFWDLPELIWTIWTMSVALREIQQKHDILWCFWASRASRRAPKSLQNRPKMSLGRRLGPEIGLAGPS